MRLDAGDLDAEDLDAEVLDVQDLDAEVSSTLCLQLCYVDKMIWGDDETIIYIVAEVPP
jgi:hypothetical protein